MNTPRCNTQNGTYICTRGAGHSGRHEAPYRLRNTRNEVIGIRVAHWRIGHSHVAYTTHPA